MSSGIQLCGGVLLRTPRGSQQAVTVPPPSLAGPLDCALARHIPDILIPFSLWNCSVSRPSCCSSLRICSMPPPWKGAWALSHCSGSLWVVGTCHWSSLWRQGAIVKRGASCQSLIAGHVWGVISFPCTHLESPTGAISKVWVLDLLERGWPDRAFSWRMRHWVTSEDHFPCSAMSYLLQWCLISPLTSTEVSSTQNCILVCFIALFNLWQTGLIFCIPSTFLCQ